MSKTEKYPFVAQYGMWTYKLELANDLLWECHIKLDKRDATIKKLRAKLRLTKRQRKAGGGG